jgi:cell division protein FtsN
MASIENKFLWNALVILTIMIGGTAAILIVGKEQYFPSLYAMHHEYVVSEDSSQHFTDEILAEAPRQIEQDTLIGNVTETAQPLTIGEGEYVLVAGSFLSEHYASNFRATLHQKLGNSSPEIIQVSQSNATYFRVVVLHSGNRSEVRESQHLLTQAGHGQSWIYKQ